MSDTVGVRSFAGHLAPADVLVGEPAGWKAALGGGTWASDLALRGALVGRLVRERIADSGAEISVAGWTSARLEPEIALRLERDVPADADARAIWDCVGAVLPAFELVDVTAGFDDVDALLRTNIYHRAVVLGAPMQPVLLDSEPVPVQLARDGALLADTVDAAAAVGGIPRVLVHISRVLAAGGEALRRGDVIMTGTVLAPPEVEPGGTYAGDFGRLGVVRVRIVAT
jgi:2-keto-4-pentenoate hydratase